MSDAIKIEPLLHMLSYKPSWSVLIPDEANGQADTPSIATRAEWLMGLLAIWSSGVDRFMAVIAESDKAAGAEAELSDHGQIEGLRLVLESLANVLDSLLAFKRRGCFVDVPDWFVKTASLLLARADMQGIRTRDLTVSEIALRLSAARLHLTHASGPVKRSGPVEIDDQGRVYGYSGERLLQFEPKKVLEGKQEIESGQIHSLRELREAERRDER